MIAKNFIRSFSFWSQGTSIYFQCSKKGILNLLSSEFFGSLADEQENIYHKNKKGRSSTVAIPNTINLAHSIVS